MHILPCDVSMAGALAAIYNRAVEPVPFCWPADADAFAAAVAKVEGQAKSDKPLRDKAAFVATDGGRIVGFIDIGVGRPEDDDQHPEAGVIPFFWYEPGRRAAGQVLLEKAEDRFRELGMTAVQAFPQEYKYNFYHLPCAYLSDHLAHVAALLAFNGYRKTRGEVFFEWPDFEPVEPPAVDLPVDIVVEWKTGQAARPNLELVARLDGESIGVCDCESLAGPTRAEEAEDWFCVHWLGVNRAFRGRGLGKHLLRRALVEMRRAGYRHAAISTSLPNHRAFVFYSHFGYRFCDWTYGWKREL